MIPLPALRFIDADAARLPAYIVRADDPFFRRAARVRPAIPAQELQTMPHQTPITTTDPPQAAAGLSPEDLAQLQDAFPQGYSAVQARIDARTMPTLAAVQAIYPHRLGADVAADLVEVFPVLRGRLAVAETPRPKHAEMRTLAAVLAANPDYRPTGAARAFVAEFVDYPEES